MALSLPKRRFISKVVGRTFREANCEKCGAKYAFVLSCEAEATAETSLDEPEEKGELLATEEATSQLSNKLAHDVAPVPCPHCGWFQADMVKQLRVDLGGVADAIAAIAILIGVVVLVISGVAWLGSWLANDGSTTLIVRRFVLGCIAAVVGGSIVLGINACRRRRWDPNARDRRERIDIGRENAALLHDFDEARKAALLAAADKRQLHRLNRSHRHEKYFKAAFTFTFGAFTAYLLALEMPLVVAAARTYSWSNVKGEVQSAVVASGNRGQEIHYWPKVDYTYAVAGHNYRAQRYYIVPDDSIMISAPSRIVRELVDRRDVVVYYDPNAPEESVLNRGLPFWKAFVVIAFTASAGGGMALAWRFVRAGCRPISLNYEQDVPEKRSPSPVVQRLLVAAGIFIVIGGPVIQIFLNVAPEMDRAAESHRREAEQQKLTSAQIDAATSAYWNRSTALQDVEALAERYHLSADEFEDILRSEWAAMHPSDGLEPWQVRISDNPYFWRIHVDWDLEAVRKRCQSAEASRAREVANDQ